MDGKSTLGTALIRGAYAGLATALVTGVTAWLAFTSLIDDTAQIMGDISDGEIVGYAAITGVIAALSAFLWRAAVEGSYDAKRAERLAEKPGDVGHIPPHPTP